jgi:hypothetical protein
MARYDRIDKFGVEEMAPEEYREREAYVIKNCKCTGCPTYVEGDSQPAYCFPFIGTSKTIQWEKDCLCETCSVYGEYDLNHTFYCTRCSQACQTMKTEGAMAQGT